MHSILYLLLYDIYFKDRTYSVACEENKNKDKNDWNNSFGKSYIHQPTVMSDQSVVDYDRFQVSYSLIIMVCQKV